MGDFNQSIKTILGHEGGLVSNPNDRGGITNFGITERSLAAYRGKIVSPLDVQMLTQDEACQIYKQDYWQKMRLDEVNSIQLATVIFDLSVLRGVPTISHDIQKILGLQADGIVGSQTIQAINNFAAPKFLALQIIKASQVAFAHLCQYDQSQIQFMANWLSRTGDLLNAVYTD